MIVDVGACREVKHMLKLALKYSSAALKMEPTNVKVSGTHVTFCEITASVWNQPSAGTLPQRMRSRGLGAVQVGLAACHK